jgi:hypothetical protein
MVEDFNKQHTKADGLQHIHTNSMKWSSLKKEVSQKDCPPFMEQEGLLPFSK